MSVDSRQAVVINSLCRAMAFTLKHCTQYLDAVVVVIE